MFKAKSQYQLLSLICSGLAVWMPLLAQTDTLVVYDVRTATPNYLLSPAPIPSADFAITDWNDGKHAGLSATNANFPDEIPPTAAGFSDLTPARKVFNVTDYPVRTAVKLFRFVDDSLYHTGSGTIVGSRYVLTAAHCVYWRFDNDASWRFRDSLLVAPAFDDGIVQGNLPVSTSARYYISKNWYDVTYNTFDDVALIELQDEIGEQTGWVGVAFDERPRFFENKVLHKFSYPASFDPGDSSCVYDGNTLYYNYGRVTIIRPDVLGYAAFGIPGQSGSTLMYTDNGGFYVFGTLSSSAESRHYRIDRGIFYALKTILQGDNVIQIAVQEQHVVESDEETGKKIVSVKESAPMEKSEKMFVRERITATSE